MKLDKFFAFCLAGALSVANVSNALAQPGGGDSGERQDPLALYKAAGINAQQEQEIRRMAKEFEDSQRVRLKTLIGLMRDMNNLQRQADPPEADVLSKQDEINKLTGEMATERVKLLLRVRKVLTPEQRQNLVKILSEAQQDEGGGGQPQQ